MAILGIVIALMFFCHFKNRGRFHRRGGRPDWWVERQDEWRRHWAEWNKHWADQAHRWGHQHASWHRRAADRAERQAEREQARHERRADRGDRRDGTLLSEEALLRRARRRAAAETSFYVHFVTYAGVIAFLFLINMLTGRATRGSSGRRSAGASASSPTTWASSARGS